MIRVGLKNLFARKTRALLTMFAIVLGVGMVSAAFTVGDTLRGGVDSLSKSTYDSTDAVVAGRQAFESGAGTDWALERPKVDEALVTKIQGLPEVSKVVGDIVDQQTKIIGSDGKPVGTGPYFGLGQDPNAGALSPLKLDAGRFATGPDEVVIDAATAEDEHLKLGSTVELVGARSDEYKVVGIARFGDVKSIGSATMVAFDLPTAQRVLGRDGVFDDLLVQAKDGVSDAQLHAAIAKVLPNDAVVESARDNDRFGLSDLDDFIGIFKVVLLVFGFVAIFVGAFTIGNALSITVAQRSRELGMLRLLGASRGQVLRSVLVEAMALGVIASAIGAAAGFLLAKGLLSLMDSMGLGLPTGHTTLAAGTVAVSMIVGIVVTTIAGLLPARRATRVAPVEALREAELRRPGIAGRAVRSVVSVLGRPARWLGGTSGDLARRNAMRQPGRTMATAAALTIGVALVTLVTVVGTGLKDTSKGSLERRVTADHVIVASDDWSPIDASVAGDAAKAPGVTNVSAIVQDAGQAFGDAEIVNGIDPKTFPAALHFEWSDGDDSVPGKLGSDGAIVDEGWAAEHALTVGSTFELTSAKGVTQTFTVRGIEHSPVLDFLGLGPVTIGTPAYDKAFANDSAAMTFVNATDTAGLKAALQSHPDVKLQTAQAWIDTRVDSVDQLLAIFFVLLALAVIVSLFGIVNTLVLATFERTHELGMLRAVGMTRRQMRRMVRHESVITALLGALSGIGIGLLLGLAVTSAFSDAGLAFVVPAGSLVAFTIVAIVAGVGAAVLPARRAARLSPLAALAHA